MPQTATTDEARAPAGPTGPFGLLALPSRLLGLVSPMSWRVPFENDPPLRWCAVPIVLVVYPLLVHLLRHGAGTTVFSLAFVLAALTGAIVGILPGLVATVGLQLTNMVFVLTQDQNYPHVAGSLSVALLASSGLVLATGGSRHLLRRMARVNRELDGQIRARRAAEATLAESLVLHQSLVRTLGEGVGLFDAEERFLFANTAAERLFGVDEGRLQGRLLSEFVELAQPLRGGSDSARLLDEPITYDLTLLGGEPHSLLVTETRLSVAGTTEQRTLRVMRDVTERVRLEEQRRELALYLQRTEAFQSLAVLAGGVAHDFNNLLSGVIGSAELGLLRLSKAPETVRPCLEEARRYALEASNLSRKMLAYAGRRGVSLESVELAREAEESLRLVFSTIAGKAALHNTIGAELPQISVDRTGLHQVLTNLLLNAAEAMPGPERGVITLSAARSQVTDDSFRARDPLAPAPGDYVVMTVTDNGQGMTEETLAHLFEPFFSTKFQGRGMGLASTLGIVRACKGGVAVTSTPGLGTTFNVYWPIAPAAREPPPATPQPPLDLRRTPRVLLVDDEASVREVTSHLLEELGCIVRQATCGTEALAYFAAHQGDVDLVLLDLTMPDKNGIAVLAELRAISQKVRVILTSGYSEHDSHDTAQLPGVVGFLPKPHALASLKSSLAIALRSSG